MEVYMLREVKTKNGIVRGIPAADPRITSFKGIPFAAPPVGENRWRAPQPVKDWDGVLECTKFAPISVQDTPGLGTDIYCREWHVDPEIPMDEDCLYLNVWTPAKKADEKLPVFVWYFGGGFQWGYTAEMEFDGERIARRGIIVVTVNYRLASLGFFAHPEITAESPEAPSNFGLLDQRAGLKWVYDNIAAFGGDPERITIAGQSAGGGSTQNQIACKENFGIIKGAVIMSGMISNPFDIDNPLAPKPLAEAEKIGVQFLEFLGVKNVEEARKLDAFYLRDKYGEFAATGHERFWPNIDGVNYVGDAYKRIVDNQYNNIPLISGYTYDEFRIPMSERSSVNIVEYSVKDAFSKLSKIEGNAPKYCYCFNPDIPGEDRPGTFHSVDLWFWFETLAKCTRPYRGRHYELSRQMCDYLCNFIKTGNPNGEDLDGYTLPEWKAFSETDRNEMTFTPDGAKPGVDKTDFTEFLSKKPQMARPF